jgi:hypothetical protein
MKNSFLEILVGLALALALATAATALPKDDCSDCTDNAGKLAA